MTWKDYLLQRNVRLIGVKNGKFLETLMEETEEIFVREKIPAVAVCQTIFTEDGVYEESFLVRREKKERERIFEAFAKGAKAFAKSYEHDFNIVAIRLRIISNLEIEPILMVQESQL